MNRILCPVDFSDAAVNAVEYAGRLATDLQMELLLLYVELIPTWHGAIPMSGNLLPLIDDQALAVKERLSAYTATVAHEFKIKCEGDVKTYGVTLAGALAEEIDNDDVALVVMGTGGATDGVAAFFGTNSYHAVRQTEKPFLLIPENCKFNVPSRILYATDYCPEDQRNIKHIFSLFARYRPQLTIFHVSKKETMVSDELFQCFRDVLEDELGNKRHIAFKRVIGDDVPDIIAETMHDQDLLVLLTKHYNFVEWLFHRSTIRKLSFSADFPILVYPYRS